jgi:hypothetical protein
MGLIVLLALVGGGLFIVLPAVAIGLGVARRSTRPEGFWPACVVAASSSFLCQYIFALRPFSFLRTHEYSWEFIFAPLFGWHLAAPPAFAIILFFLTRRNASPAANAIIAGLFFSVAVVVVLSIPLSFLLPPLLGLRFRP